MGYVELKKFQSLLKALNDLPRKSLTSKQRVYAAELEKAVKRERFGLSINKQLDTKNAWGQVDQLEHWAQDPYLPGQHTPPSFKDWGLSNTKPLYPYDETLSYAKKSKSYEIDELRYAQNQLKAKLDSMWFMDYDIDPDLQKQIDKLDNKIYNAGVEELKDQNTNTAYENRGKLEDMIGGAYFTGKKDWSNKFSRGTELLYTNRDLTLKKKGIFTQERYNRVVKQAQAEKDFVRWGLKNPSWPFQMEQSQIDWMEKYGGADSILNRVSVRETNKALSVSETPKYPLPFPDRYNSRDIYSIGSSAQIKNNPLQSILGTQQRPETDFFPYESVKDINNPASKYLDSNLRGWYPSRQTSVRGIAYPQKKGNDPDNVIEQVFNLVDSSGEKVKVTSFWKDPIGPVGNRQFVDLRNVHAQAFDSKNIDEPMMGINVKPSDGSIVTMPSGSEPWYNPINTQKRVQGPKLKKPIVIDTIKGTRSFPDFNTGEMITDTVPRKKLDKPELDESAMYALGLLPAGYLMGNSMTTGGSGQLNSMSSTRQSIQAGARNFGSDLGELAGLWGKSLSEVYPNYQARQAEYANTTSSARKYLPLDFGMTLLDTAGAILTPLSMLDQGAWGEYSGEGFMGGIRNETQPSEIFGVEDPLASLGLDMIAQPTNLLGAGLTSKGKKLFSKLPLGMQVNFGETASNAPTEAEMKSINALLEQQYNEANRVPELQNLIPEQSVSSPADIQAPKPKKTNSQYLAAGFTGLMGIGTGAMISQIANGDNIKATGSSQYSSKNNQLSAAFGRVEGFTGQQIMQGWLRDNKASAMSGINYEQLQGGHRVAIEEGGKGEMSNYITQTVEENLESSSSQSYRKNLPERQYQEQQKWDRMSGTFDQDLKSIQSLMDDKSGGRINQATEESLEYSRKRKENIALYDIEINKLKIVIARAEKDFRQESAKLARLKKENRSDPVSEKQVVALKHYIAKYKSQLSSLMAQRETEKNKHFELPNQRSKEGQDVSFSDIGMAPTANRPGKGPALADPDKIKGAVSLEQLMIDYSVMKTDPAIVKISPEDTGLPTGEYWTGLQSKSQKDQLEIDKEYAKTNSNDLLLPGEGVIATQGSGTAQNLYGPKFEEAVTLIAAQLLSEFIPEMVLQATSAGQD